MIIALAVAATLQTHVIETIARQIERRYVDIEAAPRVAAALRARTYDAASNETFAAKLTDDLRAIANDLHFAVEYDPAHEARLRAAHVGEGGKLPELPPTADELRAMRRNNFGYRRLEVLEGNVGYADIRSFEDIEQSRDVATAAIRFLAQSDAVIVDLRGNPGGTGSGVRFLASYFLPPDTPMMATFDRETGKTTRGSVLRNMPLRRTDVPLYILAGPGTGSAAEAFAFVMQQRGRARIVGEKTQGAGQGGGWVPAGEGFVVFIPTFRVFNPETGKGWEKVGVPPDGPRTLAAEDRDAFTGKYQGIEIGRDNDALWFLGASGIRRPLTPLTEGTFLIEDASVPASARARVRFIRNAAGNVVRLELLTASGRVLPRPRM